MLKKIVGNDEGPIRFFLGGAACGSAPFVSEDEGTELHFSRYWLSNPKDSYSVIAVGDSMEGSHIFAGDMLVIDAGMEARDGLIIVAWLNGELTVKRLAHDDSGVMMLVPENSKYAPIVVSEHDDVRILGVVTSVHRKLL
jgi:DNA polymerase V